MSLLKSTATIGGYTLISRLFGFVRDMLQAAIIGANGYSDAFFVAFKLPNFFRRIFAEGAFNAAFVPMFASILAGEGPDKARDFSRDVMTMLLITLLFLSAFCMIFMPAFMYILAPGFQHDPAKFDLTVALTRVTFPYLLFISLVSLLGGILNSVNRFAAVAATPILMNLCFIASLGAVWWVQPSKADAVMFLSVGVFASGVAQLLWLVYFCKRSGMLPRLKRPSLTPEVKKMLALLGPAAIGGSVAQINLMVDTILASLLRKDGPISYLYYADRISELPLAVIGIAIGTALLPTLSKLIREGNHENAGHFQNRAIELSLLLALPAAAALIVIAQPIITVIYQRGAFGIAETTATYTALIAYATGLPAFVLAKVIAPGFYARHDTKTPFRIAMVCIALNFVLNLALMGPLAHVGMALATSIAGWFNVAQMLYYLKKRGHFTADRALLTRLPRMLLATALMAGVLWCLYGSVLSSFDGALWHKALNLALLIAAGLGTYGVSVVALRAVDMERVRGLVKK